LDYIANPDPLLNQASFGVKIWRPL